MNEREEAREARRVLNELVQILSGYCGETGANEGAADTLRRLIAERDELKAQLEFTDRAHLAANEEWNRTLRERDEAREHLKKVLKINDEASALLHQTCAERNELRALLSAARAVARAARAVARLAVGAWHGRQEKGHPPGCGFNEAEIQELYREHPWLKEGKDGGS
jgi:hypothetical protein